MRSKKTKPRLGAQDKKIGAFVIKFHAATGEVPTPNIIAEDRGFSRQAGDYYLSRLVKFGLLRRGKKINSYRIVKPIPAEFSLKNGRKKCLTNRR